MARVKKDSNDYVIRVSPSLAEVDAVQWNALLAQQPLPSPFMRHEYLSAMHKSKSATPATGWTARILTLHDGDELLGGCALYLKDHSYGEYVFDWAWANAYEQHGLAYYPKAIIAVPFTPVPGTRLVARDADARSLLIQGAIAWCRQEKISSLHLLFGAPDDIATAAETGMMLRHTVQFHWTNEGWPTFDAFLASLAQEKRKKIRQERRKVADAGVAFRHARGNAITPADWDFFYSCYERTYYEHGNAPYLTRDFFRRMAQDMPDNWLLFVAERSGQPLATSLIAIDEQAGAKVAYGRYWGAIERVDCLHFEACYYQPLQWCVENGFDRFEGGAQGEHKMARALMPTRTSSAHWLAEPAFADAVERFLEKEGRGIDNYLEHLDERSPFRKPGPHS
ncbi:GNAT family N-acetyltransferase [Caenimonas koreensis]|uniref:GNAT family N-acetyltransferase n=1 Tax=Caenimonas koreensis TaxID=367474 RepID=UPI0037833DDA